MAKKPSKKPQSRQHLLLWLVGGLLAIILATALAFRLSPWPGALVVRQIFDRGGKKTLAGLERDIPAQPVTVLKDQAYGPGKKEQLDVYIPESALQNNQTLPVVIWTHGGAWLSGDKAGSAPYYSLLANQGFVVVSVNYSLAPGSTYPTPLQQLNNAHAYVLANAARFHANSQQISLAGDSAGANLSSQMAAMVTNPAYASEVGIRPALSPAQLKTVVLFCGIYKMEGLMQSNPTVPKFISWGSDVSVWAYLKTRDQSSPLVRQASPYYYVTKDFPATFISGGNGDPLTNAQSVPLAQQLTALGVAVQPLFYPADHQPKLPHEYQFTYDQDGQAAFKSFVSFVKTKLN